MRKKDWIVLASIFAVIIIAYTIVRFVYNGVYDDYKAGDESVLGDLYKLYWLQLDVIVIPFVVLSHAYLITRYIVASKRINLALDKVKFLFGTLFIGLVISLLVVLLTFSNQVSTIYFFVILVSMVFIEISLVSFYKKGMLDVDNGFITRGKTVIKRTKNK